MIKVLLVQLPVPKLNYGKKTGNIPLGAACLKQAADSVLTDVDIEILPESVSSYICDAALVNLITDKKPDFLGFTLFNWNVERSLYIIDHVKKSIGCHVIAGGPEVTPDNVIIKTGSIDTYVFGEGEEAFISILKGNTSNSFHTCSESVFKTAPSPYLSGLLEHRIENLMLLETQRGCPYHCGFCFYNKSKGRLSFKDEKHLLDGVKWAVEQEVEELYLLDPSLNARPDLRSVLKKITDINSEKKVSVTSEIRAESIDEELACLFYKAGFSGFEIGLQSTNPEALKIMRRPTNLKAFVKGASLLKEKGILPRIDLISGLPGDNLESFRDSIAFIAEHSLGDDIQVFPLSVLPGTDFRKNSRKLGLIYEPYPPYTVIETGTFSKEDILLSFDYAESLFDVALFPLPEMNVSWKRKKQSDKSDVFVKIGNRKKISKLIIENIRPVSEVEKKAEELTFPYQVFVGSSLKNMTYITDVIKILSSENPYTPFEIIFIEPDTLPDTDVLLEAVNLKRPQYLDADLRFVYSEPGNRSVLFTVISKSEEIVFSGSMKRQVYLWSHDRLPEADELDRLGDFEGIIIDSNAHDKEVRYWQDHFAPSVNYIPQISFARMDQQLCWVELTAGDEYVMQCLSYS